MTAFVLMGVSGAGKSTVGRCVTDELGLVFIEGDEFHPAGNVEKMRAGKPLSDADRKPWIDALTQAVNQRPETSDVVIACSALSRFVRERLRILTREPVHFIFLTAPRAVLEQRLRSRPVHFMKPGMLDSQLETLQTPARANCVDVSGPLERVCAEVSALIRGS